MSIPTRIKKQAIGFGSFCFLIFLFGISLPATLSAPTFTNPVPAAQNRSIVDANLRIRKDGLAFLVGTSYTVSSTNAHIRDWLSLTVLNNGGSYADSVNADSLALDVPQKQPSIAFSPVDGTGYIVWRTVHGGGFEADLRVIPPSFNGTTNKTLGVQIRLQDRLGFTIDQPTVVVDSAGNINIVGYAKTNPVKLVMVKLDRNFNLLGQTILDTQATDQREEMEPSACIDTNDNIHVVAHFPKTTATSNPVMGEFAYSRVAPATGFIKTDITPVGWRELLGRKAKDLVCSQDGSVYVAVNNTGQFDLYKRAAGPGGSEKWAKLQTNLFQIYADSVAVTTSLDGRVWAVQADGKNSATDPNPTLGSNVKFSNDGGKTFSNNERAIPSNSLTNVAVAIDGNGPGGKVHLAGSFQYSYDSVGTWYAFATSNGTPLPTPTPVPTTVPPAIAAPTNLAVTVLSGTQTRLTWVDNSNNETQFSIERDQSGVAAKEIARVGANITTFTDSGLTPSTSYGYVVRALNPTNGFSGYSQKVIVKTLYVAPTPTPTNPPPLPTPTPTPTPAVTTAPPTPAPTTGSTTPTPTPTPNIIVLNGFVLGNGFKEYYDKYGGIKVFGLPLSNEYTNPKTGLTEQIFERYVLEYNPNDAPEWQIRGKDAGRTYLNNRGF